jgi:hypothetical protein
MPHEITHVASQSWEFTTGSQALAVEIAEAAKRRGLECDWGRDERNGHPERFIAEVFGAGRDEFSAILGEATQAAQRFFAHARI